MFLEEHGYDVSYVTNIDTHTRPQRLLDVNAFISAGHDEYWSAQMHEPVEMARDAGVDLAFFGADAVYRQIRLEPSANQTPNRVIAIYNNASLDPEQDVAKKTVKFRSLGRAEQRLIGNQYIDYNPNSNTDFIVSGSDHWIYEGTGFEDGDIVPGIIGYEVNARFAEYLLPDFVSYSVVGRSPFAGVRGNVIAETVIYETSAGSNVFSSGTMSWSWALSRPGYINPGIRRMTKNLLDRFIDVPNSPTAPAVINPGNQE